MNQNNEFVVPSLLYGKAFSPEECKQILDYSEDLQIFETASGYGKTDYSQRKCTIKALEQNEHSNWIYARLISIVKEADKNYFHYKPEYLETIQLMKYQESDHFMWHTDTSTTYSHYFKRKLSIIVFLSEPGDYDGGKLELAPASQNNILMELGYMALFPSFKVHRVTPITKGIRYTLVSWANIY